MRLRNMLKICLVFGNLNLSAYERYAYKEKHVIRFSVTRLAKQK